AVYNMDALQFLESLPDASVRGVIFDPPSSTEQFLRVYKARNGGTTGRAEYWSACKNEIARVVVHGGKVICMCWDTSGIGKSRGFNLERVRVVCHGPNHNDTLITVERKVAEKNTHIH